MKTAQSPLGTARCLPKGHSLLPLTPISPANPFNPEIINDSNALIILALPRAARARGELSARAYHELAHVRATKIDRLHFGGSWETASWKEPPSPKLGIQVFYAPLAVLRGL